jgi:hypothetical protein
MNRLIFDYLRRWSLVLALVSMLEFGLGCLLACRPEDNFEFWGLLLAMWTGANLLSFDLKRGVAHAVAILPLTARQIGRSWWLATVAIPAIVLAALLYLGAGAFHHINPDKVIPAGRLAIVSLLNVAWLGTMFNCVSSTPVIHETGWIRMRSTFIGRLSAIMLLGGMLVCQNASKSPLKSIILLGVGAFLTVASWFRAERFALGRAGFRLTVPHYKCPRGRHSAPGGRGGIPFLISTNFVRTFLPLVAMVALMALIWSWSGQAIPRQQAIVLFASMGSFMSCFFIFFLQPMSVLQHLRFMRTLPVSAGELAAVMIAVAILPLIALGALAAGVAGLSLGTPVAITVSKSYMFILAPASLCVLFAVWRGAGAQACVLLLFTMFGFFLAPMCLQGLFHHQEIPFSLTGTIAAFCVLSALLLTRCALMHSSHAYRVQANPSGNLPWVAGR